MSSNSDQEYGVFGAQLTHYASRTGNLFSKDELEVLFARWSGNDAAKAKFNALRWCGHCSIHVLITTSSFATTSSLEGVTDVISSEVYDRCVSALFERSNMVWFFDACMVPPTWTRYDADMLEAIAGLICVKVGLAAVESFMDDVGLSYALNTIFD